MQFLCPHNTFLQAIINAKFTKFVLLTDQLGRQNKTLFLMSDLMTSKILPANYHAILMDCDGRCNLYLPIFQIIKIEFCMETFILFNESYRVIIVSDQYSSSLPATLLTHV